MHPYILSHINISIFLSICIFTPTHFNICPTHSLVQPTLQFDIIFLGELYSFGIWSERGDRERERDTHYICVNAINVVAILKSNLFIMDVTKYTVENYHMKNKIELIEKFVLIFHCDNNN